MNDNDIKGVLGSVFADEPPLRVHRDEVLRNGRTRLRRRRAAVLGGVVAVVAVAGFGASVLAGAVGGGRVEAAGVGCAVESVVPTVTTAPPKPCEPTTAERAEQLTAVLAEGHVVPAGLTAKTSGRRTHPDPLVFVPERAEYSASADLVTADGQTGTINVLVGGRGSNLSRAACDPPATCESRTVDGGDVQITKTPFGTAGEVLTMVVLLRADGTKVYASVSNVSTAAVAAGRKAETAPTIDRQPLTADELVKIVTLPGLRF
ncbi:hypothetical protein ACFFQW_36540 [Umezawaea endophytica]|uniref:Uncharacterized protein n=1 Tax=Umezawaea endophytica TaxID=1654476 RepID=A0A9X2VQK7_9PSEU|nr:hypothetical protein [Umezawaea endophytica]MCS7480905.1 hypothetical protein [Umezawaea endophytica]